MVKLQELSKEVLTAILKSIDEGIHVVNTEGSTIFYNEVAARHDGLSVQEVLGKPLLSAFPSLSEESSTLLKVMKTAKPIYNQTQVYLNMYGKRIDTINTTLPIMIGNTIVGAVEIAKDYSRMKLLAERLLELQKSLKQNNVKTLVKSVHFTLSDLKTKNNEFIRLKEEARKLAKSYSPILIYGESGTGKELFVQGIHYESKRANGPFIAQNCAAIPETLLESILFGTAKGSYTGAVERKGLFELADGGTLFLDELHAMPMELQAKLLRAIEDGLIRRVGGSQNITVDVRVISAINVHPRIAMEEHKLRPDLFYRLNVFTFALLPLRERKEDILYLTEYFIRTYNHTLNKQISGIDKGLKLIFLKYSWPGNVRELKHTIEYMMNICEENVLSEKNLPVMMRQLKGIPTIEFETHSSSLRDNLEALEKKLITNSLEAAGGNINHAAKLLGIPRQTLQYKIKKYM
ncbi:MAG: sigma 54-interacting transcriptional regulator [Bacillota bacterium]|nr:sigma 54-interacting transcriptional regulator [Bacillota bacterium]